MRALILITGLAFAPTLTSCKTVEKKADKPEPLQPTNICMGDHAHVALSNSKYLSVIKVLDDTGKPVKCEVVRDELEKQKKVAKEDEPKRKVKK